MTDTPYRIVDYKLRITENLRDRINRAAAANNVSHNREMIRRLEESFDHVEHRSLEETIKRLIEITERLTRLSEWGPAI